MKKEYLPLEITVRFLDRTIDVVATSPPVDENEGGGGQPDWFFP